MAAYIVTIEGREYTDIIEASSLNEAASIAARIVYDFEIGCNNPRYEFRYILHEDECEHVFFVTSQKYPEKYHVYLDNIFCGIYYGYWLEEIVLKAFPDVIKLEMKQENPRDNFKFQMIRNDTKYEFEGVRFRGRYLLKYTNNYNL